MEQIKIDIVPVGVAPVAHASQFDNGRQIRFNLFNQGTPYTLTGAETVTMVVNGEEENITNTSDNYVIWDVAEEDCEEVGVIGCEIRIVLGSMLIGSKNFFLEVEMDPYNGKNLRIVTVGPADICTFDTTLPEPYQSVTVNVEATGGNGTPDNPIPINGYTEANITRCGVNLFDGTWEIGHRWDGDGTYSSQSDKNAGTPDKMLCKPNTTYCFIMPNYAQVTFMYLSEWGANEDFIQKGSGNTINATSHTVTFTTGANTYFIAFSLYANNDLTSAEVEDIGINYPSTDTTYHAYNGTTYTISFGQTVYGGVLDVTNGTLSLTWVNVDLSVLDLVGGDGKIKVSCGMDGNLWRVESQSTSPMYPTDNSCQVGMCDQLTFIATYSDSNNNTIGFMRTNATLIIVRNDACTTAAQIVDFLNQVQVIYPLATPVTLTLTSEQIRALVGENNVFADCGETTVEYLTEGT